MSWPTLMQVTSSQPEGMHLLCMMQREVKIRLNISTLSKLYSFELLLVASYFTNCCNSSKSIQSLPVAVKFVDDSQGICKEHIESDRHSSVEKL